MCVVVCDVVLCVFKHTPLGHELSFVMLVMAVNSMSTHGALQPPATYVMPHAREKRQLMRLCRPPCIVFRVFGAYQTADRDLGMALVATQDHTILPGDHRYLLASWKMG